MELVARGRDADVYLLDEARVLRRNRDGRSAQHEAELINRVADAGFPTPRALDCAGPDLTLERAVGPDLMTAVAAGLVTAETAGVTLADLHRRLHALPWDGGALLHLDLHPLNVLWTPRGPTVIDWTNAAVGDPGFDVAMTAVILAQVAVAPDAFADVVDASPLRTAVTSLLATFAAAAEPLEDHVFDAAARRRADRNAAPRELETLDAAVALARAAARGETLA